MQFSKPFLPPELWLQVLSHLDYTTLKSFFRVSKSFEILLRKTTGTTIIDKTLFRDTPPVVVDNNTKRHIDNLHPIFKGSLTVHMEFHSSNWLLYITESQTGIGYEPKLECRVEVSSIFPIFQLLIDDTTHRRNIKIWTENATSPCVKTLTVTNWERGYPYSGRSVSVTISSKEKAVSVFDLFITRVVFLYAVLGLWKGTGTSRSQSSVCIRDVRDAFDWLVGQLGWLLRPSMNESRWVRLLCQVREAKICERLLIEAGGKAGDVVCGSGVRNKQQ